MSGSIRGAYNTNTTSYFGRAAIGYSGWSDNAAFAHVDMNSQTGYALSQDSNGSTTINAATGQPIKFNINNQPKMKITDSGQVGIGTTTPSTKLDVSGTDAIGIPSGTNAQRPSTLRVGQIRYNTTNDEFEGYQGASGSEEWSALGGGSFTIDGNNAYYTAGNVGIGTSSPTALLDVSGGDAKINTLTIGRGNGSIAENTAIGFEALENVLDNATSKTLYNTAIGYQSLKSLVGDVDAPYGSYPAEHNTAVGYRSLMSSNSNSAGARCNTAVGSEALKLNVYGKSNVAVGKSALVANANSYNVAVGDSALATNTDGNMNTAMGQSALVNNVYGVQNVAVGYSAGQYNVGNVGATSGFKNTFIGTSTKAPNGTPVKQSTALGYGAEITASNQIMLGTSTETVVNPGAVDICGNLTVGGTMSVENLKTDFITNTVTNNYSVITTEDLSINGTLTVTGDASFNGHMDICGNLTLGDTIGTYGVDNRNLNIIGPDAVMRVARNHASGYAPAIELLHLSADGNTLNSYWDLYISSDNRFCIRDRTTSNNDGFSILGNGNVGIGTITPLTTLDVSGVDAIGIPCGTDAQRPGTLSVGQLRYNTTNHEFEGYQGASGSEEWSALGGGGVATGGGDISTNIAIGYDVLSNNTTGSKNTGIGYEALLNSNSSSINTAIGYRALKSTSTGHQSIGIGYEALLNANSNYNVALGNLAGKQNTSGSNNLYLGYNANTAVGSYSNSTAIGANSSITKDDQIVLGKATTPPEVYIPGNLVTNIDATINTLTVGSGSGNVTSNTVIGKTAFGSNTTGFDNVAIGTNALYSNDTAYRNVAIGTDALYSNTIGYQNIGIGHLALNTNIEGDNNIAMGFKALYLATGSNNQAIGRWALTNTSTGNANAAIGYNAGLNNTSGSNNLYLGHTADANANNYSNSTAIGTNSSITKSDQIVLGKTTTPPEVYIPGNLGIGTTSPATSIDIVATDAIGIPSGTDAQRPGSLRVGQLRYNTTSNEFEGYQGASGSEDWSALGGGGGNEISGELTISAPTNTNFPFELSNNIRFKSTDSNQGTNYIPHNLAEISTFNGANGWGGSQNTSRVAMPGGLIFKTKKPLGDSQSSADALPDTAMIIDGAGRVTIPGKAGMVGDSNNSSFSTQTNTTTDFFNNSETALLWVNGRTRIEGDLATVGKLTVLSTATSNIGGALSVNGGIASNGQSAHSGNFALNASSNLAYGDMSITNGKLSIGCGTGTSSRENLGAGTLIVAKRIYVGNEGNAVNSTNTTDTHLNVQGMVVANRFNAVSDRRLKTNILPLTDGLTVINKLQGCTYTWKSDESNGHQSGFIAQEVEEILPHIITTADEEIDGYKIKSINYTGILPYVVESVKILTNENNELKSKNNELSDKVTELSDKLDALTALFETHIKSKE